LEELLGTPERRPVQERPRVYERSKGS
jgi:hypothetical protein